MLKRQNKVIGLREQINPKVTQAETKTHSKKIFKCKVCITKALECLSTFFNIDLDPLNLCFVLGF